MYLLHCHLLELPPPPEILKYASLSSRKSEDDFLPPPKVLVSEYSTPFSHMSDFPPSPSEAYEHIPIPQSSYYPLPPKFPEELSESLPSPPSSQYDFVTQAPTEQQNIHKSERPTFNIMSGNVSNVKSILSESLKLPNSPRIRELKKIKIARTRTSQKNIFEARARKQHQKDCQYSTHIYVSLKEEDKEIITKGGMLTDLHINAEISLLKKNEHSYIEGLQDPILESKLQLGVCVVENLFRFCTMQVNTGLQFRA